MNMKWTILLLLVAVLGNVAHAAEKEGKERPKSGMEALTWYDGDTPRTVWVDPSLVAEFGVRKEEVSRPVMHRDGLRIWSKSDNASTRAKGSGQASPVLRDAPTGAGTLRALPGNIIVTLDPAWDAQQVEQWLMDHGLNQIGTLAVGKNSIIIEAEPGLKSLELANRLYQSGEVLAAQPDWWQERQRK